MYQIISQIVIYITIAAIIGFIIGWLFSKLKSNESSEELVNIAHDELAQVKAKKNELEEELITKSSQYLQISSEIDNLKKSYLSMEMDYEELLKKSSDIDPSQVKRLEEDNFTLRQEAQKSKTVIDRLNNSLNDATNNIQTLKGSLEKNIFLQSSIKQLEEDKYKLLNNIDNLQSENRFLIQKLHTSEQDKIKLKENIQSSEKSFLIKFDNLQRDNKILKQELNIAKNSSQNTLESKKLEEKIINMEKVNLKLLDTINKVKEEKSKLSINIDCIKEKITQKKLKEYSDMKTLIEDIREKNNTLVMKLASFQEENMDLKSTIKKLKNKAQVEEKSKDDSIVTNLMSELNLLKLELKEMDTLKKSNNSLLLKLTSTEAEKDELQKSIKNLKQKIKSDFIINNFSSELNSLKNELKYLHNLKEEKKLYLKNNPNTEVDRQIHILDKDKILNFKMDNSYISQIFKD